MKTKFGLREDSRLLSAPLPIVTLGSPLCIPVPSLKIYFITDIRCEDVPLQTMKPPKAKKVHSVKYDVK